MDTVLTISLFCIVVAASAYGEWKTRDAFDEVRLKMDKINPDNCFISHLDDLYLPDDSVSHHPDVKEIKINPVFPNRTALLHLHNMAMNRAFFWGYILQSKFLQPAYNDTYDPGMMYYLLSSVADVASNPYINASSIYFSPNMSYTSSYSKFFNKTMPRFAPRAYHANFNLVNQQRISTLLQVEDLGAFEADSLSKDYTSEFYRINEWYKRWLPDTAEKRQDTKTTYQVETRYANNVNETFKFYGPPGNDDAPGPVKWTRPYFDCGRLNKWLVAAVSPVADIFPRHSQFRHIEYPTYTAAVVMEMDYDKIDINQCPPSQGNDQPNRFASTARCKENTECEPLHGWGFRRGGYQCRCAPGHRLPSIVRRPYLGEVIERATSDQYYNNFNCNEIVHESHPVQSEKEHSILQANYTDNSTSESDAVQDERFNEALKFMRAVQPHNCAKYHRKELILNIDVAKGAEEQMGTQAYMALRLANFISAFLQVSDPREVYSGNRVADKPLSEDQMFGETVALVLGDSRIWAAGTFWDRNKFTDRAFFAPFAHKQELNTRKLKLEDLARLNNTEELYTNKPWFHILKQRWSTTFDSPEKYFLKIKIRDDEEGKRLKKFERYPTFYRAANLKHGHWTRPYFDCDGHLKQWVITYAAPFFGWDNVKIKLEFKGVVAVTMLLTSLDINQCPDKYYVPNAFKGTDKCDRRSSYADQVQTPASGGGEGPAEAKPEASVAPPKLAAPDEVKPEVKPDESKEVKPLPTEVQPTPPAVQTEQQKEVKPEEPKKVKTEVTPVPESKVEATQETKVETIQETKADATQETKAEATQETKVEATLETTVESTQVTNIEATQEVSKPANGAENAAASKDQGDWQQRECELLKKINELEKVKKERTQDSYLLELKVREEEIDLLKARVKNLETELQAALSKPSGKNHEMIENIKQQHEELLSKARGMIFDKTKMVKNQELQIEALTSQIQSLKDINQITKDLLEIRNSEIKAMEDRLHAMEARFKAEKDRYGLVLQRAQTSSNINDDLRKEYETQLVLFKELREKYDQRVQALVAENERLKASVAPANGAGTSG